MMALDMILVFKTTKQLILLELSLVWEEKLKGDTKEKEISVPRIGGRLLQNEMEKEIFSS